MSAAPAEFRKPPGLWRASLGDAARPESAETGGFAAEIRVSRGHDRALRLSGEIGRSLPPWAEDASCGVVFDGVLYNRGDLEKLWTLDRGPAASDADLVLRAYQHWGRDLLNKLKGVFALIVWDGRCGALLCARDPLGVHPLFYAEVGGELLLSTSPEVLVRHPRVPRTVNRAAIADHFCLRWPKPEETYYSAVKRVLSAHAMLLDAGGRRLERYWDPVPPGAPVAWVSDEEVERFDDLLDQAVSRCLEHGPAGIYLSGGLDSVSVATVAADVCRRQGLPAPVALSLVFPAPNEEPVQRGVASRLGLPHVVIPLRDALPSGNTLPAALDLSSEWPAPLLNLWRPAFQRLSTEGRLRGCRVILTGGGGDEWLGVSPSYASDLIRRLDLVGLYRLTRSMAASYGSPRAMTRTVLWTYGVRPLARKVGRKTLEVAAPGLLRARRRRRLARSTPDWVAPDPALREELDRRAEERLRRPYSDCSYLGDIRESIDHPLVSAQMEESFESARRMEVRQLSPFLDPELVDFLCRTPPALLNKGGRAKGLVRHMLARRFPELGFDRLKKVVATRLFRSELIRDGTVAWGAMGGTRALGELGIVDVAGLKTTIDGVVADERQRFDAWLIWQALNSEAWVRPRV